MGRLLILQRHKGLSSNYDCHICDCPPDYADLALDPVSMSLFVNNTMWNEAFGMYQEHCNQYYWWGYVEGAYTSNDPVIATATVDGLVKGRSGGATSIRSSYTDYWYTYSSTLQDCVEHNRTFLRAAQAKVPPHIDSISPTRGLIGASTGVTISGNGFGTNPTVSAGTGIAVTRGPFSDTEIQATFAVAGNAPTGNHSVKVTTSQGDSNTDKTFYVQVPTKVSAPAPTVHIFTNQIATHCDGSALEYHPNTPRWGTEDCFLYTLQDQNTPTGGTISYSHLTVSEAFQWKSGSTNLPQAWSDVGLVGAQFGDEQSAFAEGGPIPLDFTMDFLQTFTITNTDNQQTWTVRKNCIRWSGSSVTVTDVTANPGSCN